MRLGSTTVIPRGSRTRTTSASVPWNHRPRSPIHAGLIVLEGLDKTGKSTQKSALEAAGWALTPLVAHIPSGLTKLTKAIYQTTEHHPIAPPVARQLLRLTYTRRISPNLIDARRHRGLVIDSGLWSTVAYSWFGGLDTILSEDAFFSEEGHERLISSMKSCCGDHI